MRRRRRLGRLKVCHGGGTEGRWMQDKRTRTLGCRYTDRRVPVALLLLLLFLRGSHESLEDRDRLCPELVHVPRRI